ncbi:MAG TPA: curli assembly protein CsgF [Paracoccaceae bacterium]|jgi:curli production assembly/transport component CsgF|nr:curli assembly protein CsgF [Paracoccaceae bacterium]
MTTGQGKAAGGTRSRRIAGRTLMVATFCTAAQMTLAQDLVYTPINPSFGGSPLNSSHLLSTANAQRTATARDANDDDALGGAGLDTPGSSNADLFVRQLEGRLLSALASQVTDAIFGENPQEGGLVTFGTTTVEFQRTLDSIRLVIIDSLDGTVTEIVVPQLVTNG